MRMAGPTQNVYGFGTFMCAPMLDSIHEIILLK